MKQKLFFIFVVLPFPFTILVTLLAHAETYAVRVPTYGMAGCGPGARLMGKDGNQVFAATTNQASSIQTFGASTGTSGCSKPKTIARNEQASDGEEELADLNVEDFEQIYESRIAIDRARQSGETQRLFR